MNRPLVLFTLSYIFGILCAYFTKSYVFIFISSLIIFILSLFSIVKLQGAVVFHIGILLFFFLGGVSFLYRDISIKGKYVDYADREVIIRGYVKSEPELGDSWNKCIIEVTGIGVLNEDTSKNTIEIKPLKGKILGSISADYSLPTYGQGVEMAGTLSIPNGKRNPGGFDYRFYLVQKGISALLYIKEGAIIELPLQEGNLLLEIGFSLRAQIVKVIEDCLPPQQAGLLNGMLIGYREGLSENVEDAFRDAGLTHIMAVSGANVAFITTPLLYLLKKLRCGRNLSSVIALMFLFLFVLITGFEASVARAVIMASVILIGRIIKREPDIYTSISFAALVLLIYSPHTLFNVGFQLSFAATLSLVLFMSNVKQILCKKCHLPQKLSDVLASTLTAQAGVLPITIYNFHMLSLVSLISNFIVVPITGLVTVLGLIMAVIGQFSLFIAKIIGFVNCLFLSIILYVTKISSGFSWATLKVASPQACFIIFYYLFIILFFKIIFPMKIYKTKIAIIAAIVLICIEIFVSYFPMNQLNIVFLDVGYGDAAFIKTAWGKTILVDGGKGGIGEKNDKGEQVLIPFLLSSGIDELDMVIATHGHNDHIGGLASVLDGIKVKRLLLPINSEETEFSMLKNICQINGTEILYVSRNDEIILDKNAKMLVLNPIKEARYQSGTLNNNSMVLKLTYNNVSILMTGDIEKETERNLLNDKAFIEAHVLKVAHHGSNTSTTESFLEAVSPNAAVISVGHNKYGHPTTETLQRLYAVDTEILRTDRNGAVILKTDGDKIRLRRMITE